MADQSWTQFRGTDGSGISNNSNVTLVTDPDANLMWRTETPGQGWSSPVTDGKLIWMTAANVTEATAEQKEKALANVQLANMKDVAGQVELMAIALDAMTGSIIHQIKLNVVKAPKPIHPMNGYASPTPAIEGDRVVVHYGQYGTWCLEVSSGKVLWHRTIVFDDSVGPGSSPVIHDGKVILTCDGMDQQFIETLSMADGQTVWKTDRPPIDAANDEHRKAYSTPLLIKVDGITQAVVPGAQWCAAYNARDGKEIWRVNHGGGFSVTPMPSLIGDRIVFSTGFMQPEMIVVDPTGKGDVTSTHVVWRAKKGGSRRSSMVADDKRLYSVSDDGILTVLRHEDGSTVYRERLRGKFSSSPMRVDNHIMVANHDGKIVVFESGDNYREISSVELDEQIMASPTVIGDDLLIRTAEAVYRFSKQQK